MLQRGNTLGREMTTIGRSRGWCGTACRKFWKTKELTVSATDAQLALLDWGFKLNFLRLREAALDLRLLAGSRLVQSSSLQLVGCQVLHGPSYLETADEGLETLEWVCSSHPPTC